MSLSEVWGHLGIRIFPNTVKIGRSSEALGGIKIPYPMPG